MNKETRKGSIWKNCITIPNMLSVFRLILIPFFVYAYCVEQNFWKTAALLALSGISDTADGYIARRFNMVSDLGKIIDPVTDKLTQAAMLLCLLTRYPLMLLPLLLLTFKEVSTGIMSLIVIRKTGLVMSADWHGKVTTGLLYAMMLTHIIWYRIPVSVSNAMIAVCTAMMLLSFVLYIIRNAKALKAGAGFTHGNDVPLASMREIKAEK